MVWQDIISTPLFWIVSTIGTVILSVLANLLTPHVSAFITRNLQARQSGLREKQIKRRDQVITLQANVPRRASAKLDAIFKLLLAMVLILMCLFLLQLGSGGLQLKSVAAPSPEVPIPILLLVLFALLFALVALKFGLDDMSLAITADRREKAGDDFLIRHGSASADEMKRFEDEWDLRTFGVNSLNLPALPNKNSS
jgi:hypothetical protein